MATINLTKGGFARRVANLDNIQSEWKFLGTRPALIDFYAKWCGPCQRLSPVLESISERYEGKVDIYKVDVDSEHELAAMFNILSIPTLLFIPLNGEPKRVSGAMTETQIKEILDSIIK